MRRFVNKLVAGAAAVLALALALALAVPGAEAASPEPALGERLARAWAARAPFQGLPTGLTMQEAERVRDAFVARLMTTEGRVAGYKAGLTSRAVQQRFGHDAPVRGVLLERMLRSETTAALPTRFGARPVIEADLLVEVGSEVINAARTHVDALKGLARVIPFIELADLTVAEGEPLTGAVITAINVGARAGVIGRQGMPVEATQAFADRLATMRVVVTDGGGTVLAASPGSAILGHPLNAVLWLLEDLGRAGVRLKPGDLLSLGAFSPPLTPRPGLSLTVRYEGLPGDPAVSVSFE